MLEIAAIGLLGWLAARAVGKSMLRISNELQAMGNGLSSSAEALRLKVEADQQHLARLIEGHNEVVAAHVELEAAVVALDELNELPDDYDPRAAAAARAAEGHENVVPFRR